MTCVAVQCIDTRTMLCSPGRWLSRRGKGPAQGCNDHASDGPTKGWVAVRSRAARATRCCSRSAAPRSPRAGTVLASWASAAATAQAAAWPPAWLGSATQACRPARLLRPRRLPTAVMPRIAWTVLRHHLLGTAVLNPQGQGSRQGRGLPRAEWACARRALGVLWLCRWMGQRFSILLLVGGTPCFWLMTASGYICQAVGHSCLCHHCYREGKSGMVHAAHWHASRMFENTISTGVETADRVQAPRFTHVHTLSRHSPVSEVSL